jgi:hypothetical protein
MCECLIVLSQFPEPVMALRDNAARRANQADSAEGSFSYGAQNVQMHPGLPYVPLDRKLSFFKTRVSLAHALRQALVRT